MLCPLFSGGHFEVIYLCSDNQESSDTPIPKCSANTDNTHKDNVLTANKSNHMGVCE